MPALSHTHTFVKVGNKHSTRWKCNDPHCAYYPTSDLVEGKASLCSLCGTEFILDREAMRRVRPRCINCSNTKGAIQHKRSLSIMSTLLNDELKGEEKL